MEDPMRELRILVRMNLGGLQERFNRKDAWVLEFVYPSVGRQESKECRENIIT